jgi:hypothetical protein
MKSLGSNSLVKEHLMAAKCDLKFYKYFAPAKNPTARQLDMIANLGEHRATKYLSSRDYLNDDTTKVLESLAAIAPQRFARTTNIGRPIPEVMQEAQQAGERLAKATSEGSDYLEEAAENIARNFRKGSPMSMEERSVIYPAFKNRMDNLPLLTRQIQYAHQNNNTQTASVLAMELVKTMGMSAAVFGDKNAVSVAMNSMKYLNRQIKQAETINRLFQNGEC